MDINKMNEMLDNYYEAFEENWKDEEYKWREVKQFQNFYNPNCEDKKYAEMLRKAIRESSNLVASVHYYPFNEILKISELNPKELKEAFSILFDEEQNLIERMAKYTEIIQNLKKKNHLIEKDGTDLRFISTMLFFAYPDRYAIYKYKENLYFSQQYNMGIDFKRGHVESIQNIATITEILAEHLKNNRQDIIKKYKEKLKDGVYYNDEELKLLAQNVIWYAKKPKDNLVKAKSKAKQEIQIYKIEFEYGRAKESSYKPEISKEGVKHDYIMEAKKKKGTGMTGEQIVIQYENERLGKIGKIAKWESVNKGDGLGYDILSYNDDGTKRYIEVKTTKGKENSIFYVTATELEASKKYKENYFLYRVYKKDKNIWGIKCYDYKDIQKFCNTPCLYAVEL